MPGVPPEYVSTPTVQFKAAGVLWGFQVLLFMLSLQQLGGKTQGRPALMGPPLSVPSPGWRGDLGQTGGPLGLAAPLYS